MHTYTRPNFFKRTFSQVQFELELCGGNILHFFHEVDFLLFPPFAKHLRHGRGVLPSAHTSGFDEGAINQLRRLNDI